MYLTISVYPEDVTPIAFTERFKLIDYERVDQLAFYEDSCGDVFTFNRFTGHCLSDEGVSSLPLSAEPLECFHLEPTKSISLMNTITGTATENEIRKLRTLIDTRFKQKDLFFNIVLLSISIKDCGHITKCFTVSGLSIKYLISINEFLLIGKLESSGNLGMKSGRASISKILKGEEIKRDLLFNEDNIILSISEQDLRDYLLSILIYPLSAL